MNTFDLFISSFINGFAHRSIRFDEFVSWLSDYNLLKGGVVIGIVCWLWFQNEDGRRTREALLAAMIASFPALAFARVLSWFVNRTRPLIETRHIFRLPYGQTPTWEGPSSFPSDHAVLFFALAAGIFIASRRTGWFALGYVSIVICLPRIFLAEHYTTDILGGAAIGISLAWLASLPPIRKPLTSWAFQWLDTNPGAFYTFSFILTYQVVELFDPMLSTLKVAKLIIQGKLP
jgi:undecaprenyl-diphosphatase